MKLAYLANVRFPSERAHAAQIAHMCQAFSTESIETDLYVSKRVGGGKEEIDEYFGIDSKFTIVRLWHGIFVPNSRFFFYQTEFTFILSFLLHGKIKDYDVILSRSEWMLWFLSFFISTKNFVWESHEARFRYPGKRLLIKGVRCVCISEGVRDVYLNKGFPPEQFLVAHDGIDESFLGLVESKKEARERLKIPQKDFVAMYIGGFEKWKGVKTFFQASKISTEFCFVVIGGDEESILELKKEYPNVIFLGPRPYRELKDNQQAADVLVVPNTAEDELSAKFTSPLKIFAHMTSGVPLVISDVPSLTRVVKVDSTSLFLPDSPDSLLQAIDDICKKYSEKKFKAVQMKSYAQKYTWNERAKSIIKFAC